MKCTCFDPPLFSLTLPLSPLCPPPPCCPFSYVEAAQHLDTVRREEGLLRHIAVTNFDAAHLKELLDAGIPICANQVQYVECIHCMIVLV